MPLSRLPSPIVPLTDIDADSFQASFLRAYRLLNPEVTDFNESSISMVLVQLAAALGETELYYISRWANEAFLPYCRQQRSMRAIARLLAYRPRGRGAAVVPVNIELSDPAAEDVFLVNALLQAVGQNGDQVPFYLGSDVRFKIEAGQTKCRYGLMEANSGSNVVYIPGPSAVWLRVGDTLALQQSTPLPDPVLCTVASIDLSSDPLAVTLAEDLPASFSTGDSFWLQVPAYHGEQATDSLGVSDGTPSQSFVLDVEGVILTSVTVLVGPYQEEWLVVDRLTLSTPTSRHCIRDLDELGRVRITFGDGRNGKIPAASFEVGVSYVIGGGIVGNIGEGRIALLSELLDVTNQPVEAVAYNYIPGTGGAEPETLEETRYLAPASLEAGNRAVNDTDFDTLARAFTTGDGQACSGCWVTGQNPNVLRARAWGQDGSGRRAAASATLLSGLRAYLLRRMLPSQNLAMQAGGIVNINVVGVVALRRSTASVLPVVLTELADSVRQLIRGWPLGYPFRIYEIVALVESHPEVEALLNLTPSDNIPISSGYAFADGTVLFIPGSVT